MKDFIEPIKKQKLGGLTLVILTYLMFMGVFISCIGNISIAAKYAGIVSTIVVVCILALNKIKVLNLAKTNFIFKVAYLTYVVYVIFLFSREISKVI